LQFWYKVFGKLAEKILDWFNIYNIHIKAFYYCSAENVSSFEVFYRTDCITVEFKLKIKIKELWM
jgi:hypothetical protein